jgi:hypothetical protein
MSKLKISWSVVPLAVIALGALPVAAHGQKSLDERVNSITEANVSTQVTTIAEVKASPQVETVAETKASQQVKGVPEDWTHQHVVFSNPGTEQDAIRSGRYAQWLKIVNEPRYAMQQAKRGLAIQAPSTGSAQPTSTFTSKLPVWFGNRGGFSPAPAGPNERRPVDSKSEIKQDWNETISGGTPTSPSPVLFPAKWAVADTTGFNTTTASCGDFVIYPTGSNGDSFDATLVAYYNLYAGGCSGTVPQVAWAFDTGGTVTGSPVFSADGTQIAFIQGSSTDGAYIAVLRLPTTLGGYGTPGAPDLADLTETTPAAYTTCPGPCLTYEFFPSGYVNASEWSSPYYDYASDTLYVGDAVGKLHKFNPVFNGALAEDTTSPWPVQLTNTAEDPNPTTSPVYDSTSGNVFIGTTNTTPATSGGYLYSVNAGTGAINGYVQLDTTWGLRDGVLLDGSAEQLYAFVGNDANGNNGVFQLPADFTSSTVPVESILGTGGSGTNDYQFTGTFDNTYYSNSTPTGNIYTCGTGSPATLYQVPILDGVMSVTGVAGPAVGTVYCSPVSEFYNSAATTDYLFLSVYDSSEGTCLDDATDGCVMSFNVTSPTSFNALQAPLGTLDVSAPSPAAAVTGGIIIDNDATNLAGGGTSQVYFATESATGTVPCTGICGIQASQDGLH